MCNAVRRNARLLRFTALSAVIPVLFACASFPEPVVEKHGFPKNAFKGKPERPYKSLGWVRAKVNYATLDPNNEEKSLCFNYYNEAVGKLVAIAKSKGGDAVADVKSVVFLMDGSMETHPTPECSDDGAEGQVLVRGVAVKWLTDSKKTPQIR